MTAREFTGIGIDLGCVIDSLQVGIIILDGERRIRHCNRWLAERSGLPASATDGRLLEEVFADAKGSRLEQAVHHAIDDRLPSLLSPALHGTLLALYQTPGDRRHDRRMQQMIHVVPLLDKTEQTACLIQISDMTANISRERLLRQQTETLRRTTTQDDLTGVANRRRFDDFLAGEFHKAQRKQAQLALMIIDLDAFSRYNTHYGRERGDVCLSEIAATLQDAIRPLGDLLARYAGDKFALILPGLDEREACRLAENLRLRVGTLNIANPASPTGHLTVSIGLTVMQPSADADTHTLLSSADVALYQAKHEGRNRVVYFSAEDGSFRSFS